MYLRFPASVHACACSVSLLALRQAQRRSDAYALGVVHACVFSISGPRSLYEFNWRVQRPGL